MTASITGTATSGARPNAFHAAFDGIDDLAARGYEEEEWIVEGEARGRPEGSDPQDSQAVSTRPFRTRLLVRRPSDPARASGRVVVEWLNVSGGHDIAVTWSGLRDRLTGDATAWVGVTAQPLGVRYLTRWDPERYGALAHPGLPDGKPPPFLRDETFSEAVFTEIGALVRAPGGAQMFGGAPVRRLYAWGQSQSAARLTRYLDTTHRDARVYDGFVLHGGGSASLGDPEGRAAMTSWVAAIDTPVIKLDSENEALNALGVDVDDTDSFRWWQVAATGHSPSSAVGDMRVLYSRDVGIDGMFGDAVHPFGPPTIEHAMRAASHHLEKWVEANEPAPRADRLTGAPRVADAARDEHGNALGGVRLPHVEAPLGRFLARNEPGDVYRLFPGFVAFDAATLARLYPERDSYAAAIDAAAERATESGFLLPADAAAIRAEAAEVAP